MRSKKSVFSQLFQAMLFLLLINFGPHQLTSYAQAYSLTKGVKIYQQGDKYGLETDDTKITEALYSKITPFQDDLFLASRKGRFSSKQFYGLINGNGKIKLPFIYDNLEIGGDFLIAVKKKEKKFLFGIIDAKGKVKLPLRYYSIKALGNDIFLVKDLQLNQKIIALGRSEKIILEDIQQADTLKRGAIVYNRNGKYGMIDKKGATLIPDQYKSLRVTKDDKFELQKFPSWNLLNIHTDERQTYLADSIIKIDSLQTALLFNQYTHLITEKDTLILEGKLESVFQKKWMILRKDDKLRLVKKNGEIVEENFKSYRLNDDFLQLTKPASSSKSYYLYGRTELKFKADSFQFAEEYISFKIDGFWGVLDKDLREVIPPIYDEISFVPQRNEFIVKFRDRYGVIDLDNEWIVNPAYFKLEFWPNYGYWAVNRTLREFLIQNDKRLEAELHFLQFNDLVLENSMSDQLWTIDKDFSRVPLPIKGSPKDAHANNLLLKSKGKWLIFNTSLQKLSKQIAADTILLGKQDYHIIKRNNAYGMINNSGKLLIANRYDSIQSFKEGLAAIKIRGRWGFINDKEEIVIQPYYNEVSTFENGLAISTINSKQGLINKKGMEIVEHSYDHIKKLKEVFLIQKGRKVGVANNFGNFIFYPNYDEISLLGPFIKMRKYGKEKLYDKEGNLLINSNFDKIYSTKEAHIYLTKKVAEKKYRSF